MLSRLKKDLHIAMKARDTELCGRIRYLIGEIERMDARYVTEDIIIAKFRKMYTQFTTEEPLDLELANIITTYLPILLSDEEVTAYIQANYEIVTKPTTGLVVKALGNKVTGKQVSAIINNLMKEGK